MSYDAVIIGAGPSGLAAAARLAHFGVKVCVLDAHRRPGGLNSWHHVRGHEISSGLHAFTNYYSGGRGGVLGRLLRQLRIKYTDLQLCPQRSSSIRFPSATLRFTNDPEFLRQQVAEIFPAAVDGFDRFRALIRNTDEGEITSRQSSTRDVIHRHISDPLLADMLLCPVMYYGNPGGVGDGRDGARSLPDMDWLLFCVVWKCIFETGLAYPAQGIRPLWEQLVARIAEDGGDIRMGSRAVSLVTSGGRVAAVRLESGEEIDGKLFFSSAGAFETRQLLDSEPRGADSPPGSISVVEGIRILDCHPADAGMADANIYYSFEDRLRFGRPGGLVEETGGVVSTPGNYLLPEGTDGNVIKLSQLASFPAWSGLSPAAYAAAKTATASGMTRALQKLGITTAGDATCRFAGWDDVFTPVTLKRFTRHAEGALYGSTVKARGGATARSNLFLIGADEGFHGIVGAMLSGVAMVNMHLLAKRAE